MAIYFDPQEPILRYRRIQSAAIVRELEGVERPYVYVQYTFQLGEVDLPVVRHPHPERGAATHIGDHGIYSKFVPSIPPTPFIGLRRKQTGKVVLLSTISFVANPPVAVPRMNESCALIIGPLPTANPILFTFIKPDGTIQLGDSTYAYIGNPAGKYFGAVQTRECLVYIFGLGELSQAGKWGVFVSNNGVVSDTFNFLVSPY